MLVLAFAAESRLHGARGRGPRFAREIRRQLRESAGKKSLASSSAVGYD